MTHYLNPYQILVIHKRIIDITGGLHGLRDAGLLEAAIHRPKASFGGEEFYPTLFLKAAALFHSLIFNHAFVDGNKRTAFTATAIFLQRNGYRMMASNSMVEAFVLRVVVKKLTVQKIALWIKENSKRITR